MLLACGRWGWETASRMPRPPFIAPLHFRLRRRDMGVVVGPFHYVDE